MKNVLPFLGRGNWYKGNLHTHSTLSDGKLSPEQVVALYRRRGWDFLALTDHRLYNHGNQYSKKNFLMIPGVEMDIWNKNKKRHNHMVAIRSKVSRKNFPTLSKIKVSKWKGKKSVQEMINFLRKADNFVFYCHPVWSRTELEDFIDLNGCLGLEIYNHGCHVENNTGMADIYWDSFLRRKIIIYGFATDDSHHRRDDACGGWITVKAGSLTEAAIIQSILQGRFYASTGPSITDFGLRKGSVFIKCSPAREIHFVTWETHGHSLIAPSGKSLKSAIYKLKGNEIFVRAEVVDSKGKKAWTNPIFLKK